MTGLAVTLGLLVLLVPMLVLAEGLSAKRDSEAKAARKRHSGGGR